MYLKNTCEGNSIPTKFFHHFGLQYWSPVTVTVCSTVAFVVIKTHKLHFMCPVFPNTARFLAQILYPSKLWKIPCFPQGSASLLACGIRAPDVNAFVTVENFKKICSLHKDSVPLAGMLLPEYAHSWSTLLEARMLERLKLLQYKSLLFAVSLFLKTSYKEFPIHPSP